MLAWPFFVAVVWPETTRGSRRATPWRRRSSGSPTHSRDLTDGGWFTAEGPLDGRSVNSSTADRAAPYAALLPPILERQIDADFASTVRDPRGKQERNWSQIHQQAT